MEINLNLNLNSLIGLVIGRWRWRWSTMTFFIGDSHSYVTEERGFGGHCFPKDTQALVTTANNNNINLSLIKQAIDYNNFWLDLNNALLDMGKNK